MPLDMFTRDQDAALARVSRSSAPNLPANFGDTIEASWSNAVLFGQSVARLNARSAALYDHAQDYYDRTGDERLSPDALRMDIAREPVGSQPNSDLARYNARVAQVLKDVPEREASGFPTSRYAGLQPLTDDDLDDLARRKSGEAREAYKAMAAREKTAGGSFGMFAGGAGGALVDPVNVLAFPLAAPEGMGVLATTGIWAAIAGGTQTAIEAAGAPFREQVEPGYLRSGEPFENIAGAAAFGGGFGGSLKLLGNGWRYLKTKEWPRTIRDAGNVVESEANVADTNPFRGVGGEAAHRDALRETIDNLTEGPSGRPADVGGTVTPEHVADYEKRLTPIMNARRAAIEAGERAAFLEREEARLPGTMERLSERQLGEIAEAHEGLATGLEERTAKLTEQAEKAHTAHAEQTATVERMRGEIEALRRDVAEGRAKPETLERREVQFAKAEARLDKLAATAEERAAQLPLRTVTAEARAATRQGRTASEMAKAVTRLAEDGYGVKLSAEEAKALGDRILKAKPDEREVTLRETTEALVERSRAQRAVAPEMPFGKPRPHEEQRAVATRITNLLCARIQSRARESGYAMPRDEAATIAERMKAVKEPDALAILDELGVRPRTLARTLTEPRPEVPADLPSPPEMIAAARGEAQAAKPWDVYPKVKINDIPEVGDKQQALIISPEGNVHDLGGIEGGHLQAIYDMARKEGIDVEKATTALDEYQANHGIIGVTRWKDSLGINIAESLTPAQLSVVRDLARKFGGQDKVIYSVTDRSGKDLLYSQNVNDLKAFVRKPAAAMPAEQAQAEQLVQGLRTEPVNENAAVNPPVPKNHVRLYRAEGPNNTQGGLNYTSDLSQAQAFARMQAGRKIYYIDVPKAVADTIPKDPRTFYSVTPEIAATRAPLEPKVEAPAPVADTPIPSWLQQARQEAVDFANKIGVTEDIRRMASEGKTAAQISKALGERLSVDEVRAVRDSLGIAPAGPQGGIGLGQMPANEQALAEQMATNPGAKISKDPEHAATMERDFQRMRAETPDREIPVGVDKDGNPVTRTVEEAAEEIEQRRLLAEEIKASCGPQPKEAAGGGE